MKIRYLTVAALAVGVFAAQPVLAQSEAHEADPYATHSTKHKKKHTSHKKTKPSSSASSTSTTKTQ